MKPLYLTPVFLFLFFNSIAQGINEKVYIDTSLTSHHTIDMVLNADGTMVFCGAALTNDTIALHRSFIMKLNTDYTMAWYKAFQRQDPYQYYYFKDIIAVNDGGYLVTFGKDQTGSNIGIMKTDSVGNIQYERQLTDTVQQSQMEFYSILQTTDSTFLLSLKINSPQRSTVILKIDLWGNILDKICFSGAQPCFVNSIIKLLDGNYLLATTENDGPFNLFSLHCLDENLDTIWNKNYYEGFSWAFYAPVCPMQLSDSSIWILSRKNVGPSNSSYEPVISKFSNMGDMIWSKKYSDTAHVNLWFSMGKEINGKIFTLMPLDFYTPTAAYVVVLDTSGNVLAKQGFSYSNYLNSRYFEIKNDSLLIPFNCYGAPDEFGFFMVDTSLTHSCSNDIVSFLVDTISPFAYNFNSAIIGSAISMIDPQENYSTFTQIFSEIPFCTSTNIAEVNYAAISLYPNPADESIKIDFHEHISKAEIHIYDTYGRTMSSTTLSNKNNLTINVGNFAAGIYFISIGSDSFKKTISFVRM